ncbi:MAG: DNA mismatch repair endonuclease MutL [Acholeplasmataceae bacterium]
MANIKLMSNQLANMIAAGEVVEQPQHVIKELVENAMDAQAKHITINVKDEGLSLIRVEDDGIGMSEEDLTLSIQRHATSKVFNIKDLQSIQTLGFRGEALAAIASVSKLKIFSKTKETSGKVIEVHSGEIKSIHDYAMNQGTIVEITQLFFNTPARFKFMKSSFQQQKYIRQLFMEMALSHPMISFQLMENDKIYKQTSGSGDTLLLIEELFGKQYASVTQKVTTQIAHTKMELFLGSPDINVSTKSYLHTFVNQRYVKHYGIQESIVSGYDGRLMTKRYPFVLCYITIDPQRIDINIHPQKLHVKLTNESVLAYHIRETVANHLNSTIRPLVRPMQIQDDQYSSQTLEFEENLDIYESNEVKQTKIPTMYYIGMLGGTYGIFQNHEGLFLVDAHAAQERVRYEYYQDKFDVKNVTQIQRIVAFPWTLDNEMIEDAMKQTSLLKSFQFDVSKEGIHAHPQLIKEVDLNHAVEIILNDQTLSMSQFKDQLSKDISCKGSIKANQRISHHEFEHLIASLNACDEPYHCPHGRPTIIQVTYQDIEKMFKRIV